MTCGAMVKVRQESRQFASNLRDLQQVIAWARSKSNKMILWARGAATCVATRYQAIEIEKSANDARIDNL